MPQFSPDQVVFGDGVGIKGTGVTVPIIVSISSLCRFLRSKRRLFSSRIMISCRMLTAGSNSRSIVESHNQIHTVLRQIMQVSWRDGSFTV